MTRGGMLDVILTDDDGEPEIGDGAAPRSGRPGVGRARRGGARASAGAAGPDGTLGGRRRPSGVRLWWTVLAALAVAVVGVGVVEGGREQDRAERLTGVPGLLAPLDGAPDELWRAPGGAEHTVTVGGGLVLATFLTFRGHVLVGTDAATGVERWTAPLPELPNTRDLACVTVGAGDRADPGTGGDDGDRRAATHVVCRLVTALASLADGGQGFAASGLLVLDAVTGARVDERPLDSRYSTLAVAGPDLLLVELLRDGHGGLMREDPVTGSVLWTFRTDRPLPDLGDGLPVPTAQVRHGVIVTDGPAAWALTPAGSLLGEWFPKGPRLGPGVRRAVDLTVLPDGRFAVTDATTDATTDAGSDTIIGPEGPSDPSDPRGRGDPRDPGHPAGTVTASGSWDGFPIPGRVLTPAVDDGSAPDVLLTVPVGAGQVVAVDLASGRELWRAQIRVGGQAVLLDGHLVVLSGRGVRAIDVATGDTIWVAPDVVPSGPQLLTDGEVVLVPVLARRAGPELVALGLADGGVRWRAAVPAGVQEFEVGDDGRLLALTGRVTVALG